MSKYDPKSIKPNMDWFNEPPEPWWKELRKRKASKCPYCQKYAKLFYMDGVACVGCEHCKGNAII